MRRDEREREREREREGGKKDAEFCEVFSSY
jgi:hypothetical protein